MKTWMQALGLFSYLILSSVAQAEAGNTTHETVDGVPKKGTTCRAHLENPGRPVALYLDVEGNGLYLREDADFPPSVAGFVKSGAVAALTYDKPGIVSDRKAKEGFKIEDAYDKHTMADLVECAINALKFARKDKTLANLPILMLGRSEGGHVLMAAYDKLIAAKDPIADDIRLISIHASPMHNWAKGINFLLSNRKEVQAKPLTKAEKIVVKRNEMVSYEFEVKYEGQKEFFQRYNKGDKTLELTPFRLKYDYLRDAIEREPLGSIVKRIATAKKNPELGIAVYQPLIDIVEDELDLFKLDEQIDDYARKYFDDNKRGTPVRFSARYYRSGHGLNPAAWHDSLLNQFFHLPRR